jgi:hypothetical protein
MQILLLVDCSRRELCLRLDLDVRHDVSAAPGGGLPLTSNPLASNHPVDYASGTLGLGLAYIFCLRLNADGRLTYVPAYLHSGLLTFRLTYIPAYLRSGLPTFRLTCTSLAAQPT